MNREKLFKRMLDFENKYKNIDISKIFKLEIAKYNWEGKILEEYLLYFQENGILLLQNIEQSMVGDDFYLNLEKHFGGIIPQGKENTKLFTKVQKTLNGKTYFESSRTQSPHSDGAYSYNSPKTISLFCRRQAENGGENILIDANKLVDFLKKINLLDYVVDRNFIMEKWGVEVIKPIISTHNNRIEISYTPFIDNLIPESEKT